MLILGGVVTLLGSGIVAFALGFLARGQKLPADGQQPQRIEFKGFQLTTDRVGLLVFIGAAAMALPLVLLVNLTKSSEPDLQQCRASEASLKGEVSRLTTQIDQQKVLLENEPLMLTARVESASGDPVTGLEGRVLRDDWNGTRSEACPRSKLINGEFTCRTPLHDLHTRFLFDAMKAGGTDPVGQLSITPMEPIVTLTMNNQQ